MGVQLFVANVMSLYQLLLVLCLPVVSASEWQTKPEYVGKISKKPILSQGNHEIPRVNYPTPIPPDILRWSPWSRSALKFATQY